MIYEHIIDGQGETWKFWKEFREEFENRADSKLNNNMAGDYWFGTSETVFIKKEINQSLFRSARTS